MTPNVFKRDLGIGLTKVVACFAVVGLHVFRRSGGTLALYHLCGLVIPIFFTVNGWFVLNRPEVTRGYVVRKVGRVLLLAVV